MFLFTRIDGARSKPDKVHIRSLLHYAVQVAGA
jgi:hypothetical protein